MSVNRIDPYLHFNGNASEALAFYEKALGAKVTARMGFGEMPGMKVAPEHKDRILHAEVRIDDAGFMLSDTMPDQPMGADGNIQVCLNFTDAGELKKRFSALAEGGKVTMPVSDTFWDATFGMLVDRFGIRWMMNCQKSPCRAPGSGS